MWTRLFICFTLIGLIQINASSQSSASTTVGSRFVVNGNGTITDSVSGLMWEQSPISARMSWKEAIEYAKSLRLAGYSDWRLPYRIELRELVQGNQSDYASWLNSQGFRNMQPDEYWSGTYFEYLGLDYGWVVHLLFGGTHSVAQDLRAFVWFVRGGK